MEGGKGTAKAELVPQEEYYPLTPCSGNPVHEGHKFSEKKVEGK